MFRTNGVLEFPPVIFGMRRCSWKNARDVVRGMLNLNLVSKPRHPSQDSKPFCALQELP